MPHLGSSEELLVESGPLPVAGACTERQNGAGRPNQVVVPHSPAPTPHATTATPHVTPSSHATPNYVTFETMLDEYFCHGPSACSLTS